jgi:hypothetical protein
MVVRDMRWQQWWSCLLGWYAQEMVWHGSDHPTCASQRTKANPLLQHWMKHFLDIKIKWWMELTLVYI